MEQEKDSKGRFVRKSDSDRKIRSIRATDETWDLLGDKAEKNDMTRADYLEALVRNVDECNNENNSEVELDFDVDEVVDILKEALTLKSNAGGKIKIEIKRALELIGVDLDENA